MLSPNNVLAFCVVMVMISTPVLAKEPNSNTEAGLVVSVRYFEIPVSNLDRACEFYEAVFGIALKRATVDGYEMALFPEVEQGLGASGALAIGDVYVPGKAGPILYFTVESIDEVFARLHRIDGKVLYPRKALGPEGYVAELEDSEGNRIALYQSSE